MCFLLCFLQFILCAACHYVHTMLDEIADELLKVEQHWATLHQSDIIHSEA